jgi:hypothetical protein
MSAGTEILPREARVALDEYLTVLGATLDRHGMTVRGPQAHDGYAACNLIVAVVNDAASIAR